MKPSADKDIKKYAETVQKLRENRNLSDDEFALLMGCSGTLRGDETAQEKSGTAASEQEVDISETDRILFRAADEVRRENYSTDVYIRGLIEFTNYCRNDCYYCGIRCSNSNADRYRLTYQEIMDCCREGYRLGFRTFVLQGGEDPYYTDEMIEQSTDEEKVRELLQNEKVKFYIGFDPTADCLHVGHFMQVIIMMYMQKYGHTPVVLLGGGTGFVGDPSGRTDMRQMMTPETIENNCAAFKKLFDRFLDFDEDWKYEGNNGVFSPGHENKTPEPGKAISVNNARWLLPLNYIEFIREIGSCFNVNTMLRAECFRQRMDREGGLTMFELNYMLMQSYDFMVMARDFDVKIEFGGNDQWSNIIGGVDLTRKKIGKEVYGMTFSLLTNSEGKKMGKTQKGALWLDADKTSPYEFYQYWRNVGDADVEKCLRMLTFLPMDEVKRLSSLQDKEINKAKEVLAFEVTKLVHGEEEATKAQEAARAAFSGKADLSTMPTVQFAADKLAGEGMGVVNFIKELGLVPSNREGFMTIEQGGLKIDGEKVTDKKTMITADIFTDGKVLVEKGKKKKIVVELV